MKKLICCFAVASLLALGGSAIAELCSIEAAPAASLLLPYFAVDYDNPAGVNTIFTINNASATAALTHVVVWSDASVEVLDFNVYLTGYDMQTVNLGLALKDGLLPITANDPDISNVGAYSVDDGNSYPGCDELGFPYDNENPPGDGSCGEVGCARLADIEAILLGDESQLLYPGACGAFGDGDGIAKGYVTIDLVADCTLQTPCGQGWENPDQGPYFTGDPETSIGQYDNILWGDWFMVNGGENFAQGDTLVHIQAANPASELELGLLDNGSFYNRCIHDPAVPTETPYYDYRETLGTHFAAAYYINALFTGGTQFMVWRDSTWGTDVSADMTFDCGDTPGWYPIGQRQIVIFDEEENPVVPEYCQISPCPPGEENNFAPREVNTIDIAEISPFESGWIYMNLNESFGADEPELRQNWVQTVSSAEGRFSVGMNAITIADFCDSIDVEIGPYDDGFPVVLSAPSPYEIAE